MVWLVWGDHYDQWLLYVCQYVGNFRIARWKDRGCYQMPTGEMCWELWLDDFHTHWNITLCPINVYNHYLSLKIKEVPIKIKNTFLLHVYFISGINLKKCVHVALVRLFPVHCYEEHEICQLMVPAFPHPTLYRVLTVACGAWSFMLKHCLLREGMALKCGKQMMTGWGFLLIQLFTLTQWPALNVVSSDAPAWVWLKEPVCDNRFCSTVWVCDCL